MKMTWKSKVLAMIMLATMGLLIGCGTEKQEETTSVETKKVVESGEKHHVEIKVKEYGTIAVELDTTYAPDSVDNFMTLAQEGFYDGLTVHRIIKEFMIQGGDPKGDGTGGSKETIKGEFEANGVENPNSHTRGAIAMARSNDMDSARSQFFIVHKDSPHLDGQYAVFGYVTTGMDVVDAICEKVKAEDDNGTVLRENQPIIESVKVID